MNRRAKALMLQGTGSHVGKSVLVAALCRIFRQDGFRVAPFKSQNMALNSGVTTGGGEIGRAQIVQAEAAGIDATTDMNPILIKPTADSAAQVIVHGKPLANLSAIDYRKRTRRLFKYVTQSYDRLADAFDIIVIEGAGSPAEVNLRRGDIVNMRTARMADAPVLLVGDIDRGGVIAALLGTMKLLTKSERDRIAGLVINKFRGDRAILQPALDIIEKKCGRPIAGVIPYFKDIAIEEEDSVSMERTAAGEFHDAEKLNIDVLMPPHISNFTDFDVLDGERDVSLRYVRPGRALGNVDMLVIPGSKNTIDDLEFLCAHGYREQILAAKRRGALLFGICGGYQMLGKRITDPLAVETTAGAREGLGLLDIDTTLEADKVTSRVKARATAPPFSGEIEGYEIHMGKTSRGEGVSPLFELFEKDGEKTSAPDGAVNTEATVFGTYIHGVFDNNLFRRSLLNHLRNRRGWKTLPAAAADGYADVKNTEYDKLAAAVRAELDMKLVYRLLDIQKEGADA